VHDLLNTLSDSVRTRILGMLGRAELTVNELCAVLQLPQSTVSRHIRTLVDGGWVLGRREGTSRWYRTAERSADSVAGRLWSLVGGELAEGATALDDGRRLERVLAQRHQTSQGYFSAVAAEWAEVRTNLFGTDFDRIALLGLLDRTWTAGDLGTGVGQMTSHLAPFVHRVIAVDESKPMLDTARARLADAANVDVRQGRLEALPIDDAELDVALMVLVLHYLPDPAAAIREAGRCVRPGGRLLVADMLPHSRTEYQHTMGHRWLGFEPAMLSEWLTRSGFEAPTFVDLPTDTQARGPALFAATATRR
jgi:ArsR family transcriptional regulator